MELHNLKPAKGSNRKKATRLGRGDSSGKGRSSTRGTKGAKSRSGYAKKIGFEGGQMPLQRRVPKFGFHNRNHKEYKIINLARIQELVDAGRIKDKIDFATFIDTGIAKKNDQVKVLGEGKLKAKLVISAHKFSSSAKEAIEKAGGKAVIL